MCRVSCTTDNNKSSMEDRAHDSMPQEERLDGADSVPSINRTTTSNKRRNDDSTKSVSFNPTVKVRKFFKSSRQQASNNPSNKLWYTKEESRAHRKLDFQVIQLLRRCPDSANFQYFLEHEQPKGCDWTLRGIEHYSDPELAQRRRRIKVQAAVAVLVAQERYYCGQGGDDDSWDSMVAIEYCKISSSSLKAAQLQALQDAEAVGISLQ